MGDCVPSRWFLDLKDGLCMGDPVFREQDGLASSVEFGGVAHESSASVPKLGGDFMEWDSQEQVKIAGERIFGADVSMPDSFVEPV